MLLGLRGLFFAVFFLLARLCEPRPLAGSQSASGGRGRRSSLGGAAALYILQDLATSLRRWRLQGWIGRFEFVGVYPLVAGARITNMFTPLLPAREVQSHPLESRFATFAVPARLEQSIITRRSQNCKPQNVVQHRPPKTASTSEAGNGPRL